MTLRYAVQNDLPCIADIAAQAMLHDELFIHLCPHRFQYYADFRTAFLRRLKMRFFTPGYVMLVVVEHVQDGDTESERVRGYALWSRHGNSPEAKRWQNFNNTGWWKASWNVLERSLLSVEDRYNSYIAPDRSLDPERLDRYIKACASGYDFSAISELWFLATVAVDPLHQRRGFGRRLVQWGLDRAKEERVSVGLDASLQGLALYEALGFRTVQMVEIVPGLKVPAMLWEVPPQPKTK